MLKLKLNSDDIFINHQFTSEEHSTDRLYYNEKLLKLGSDVVINDIVDAEVDEFKPFYDVINFNLFFLRYFTNSEINEFSNFVEPEFNKHVFNTRLAFGLINANGNPLPKIVNNPFEHRQENQILAPELRSEAGLSRFNQLKNKPYPVNDIIGASLVKKPKQAGLPIYYNSYSLPIWEQKEKWFRDPLLYSNKAFFNNSFLLLEVYDSPNNLTQNRLFSIPIFTNPRYNYFEKIKNTNVLIPRPSFHLKDGDEGYSFLFLRKYFVNDFYVKFSYWDSLNNRKIQLLPSATNNYTITNEELSQEPISNQSIKVDKRKWFQNLNTFNQESRYIKYSVDYNNKTYKMFDYDYTTNTYANERSSFDFYELIFDDFWVKTPVVNDKPINAASPILSAPISNPFIFNIKNIDLQIKENSNFGIKRLVNLPFANINTQFKENLTNFTIQNIDNDAYVVERIDLRNMQLITGNFQKSGELYRSYSDSWEVINKKKSTEVNFIPEIPRNIISLLVNAGFNPVLFGRITPEKLPILISDPIYRDYLVNFSVVLNAGKSYTLDNLKKMSFDVYFVYGYEASKGILDYSPMKITGELRIILTNTVTKNRKNVIVPINVNYKFE